MDWWSVLPVHEFRVQVGPAAFRIGSAWRAPLKQLSVLYADYPKPDFTDFTIRLEPMSLLRRWIKPSVTIGGDHTLPDAAPLPLAQGLLAAEMAMNLQMALGWRRHLLLHASTVERDGRVLMMTGVSGSGKSTLSAMLGSNGWRFMGDEFALIDPASGNAFPFPRPISLKNNAIMAMQNTQPCAHFGPLMHGTPKGDICHMVPSIDAIKKMGQGGVPALLLFPRYGHPDQIRDLTPSETFMRLTQASTNYVALGETGFSTLTRFVKSVPAYAIDYQSGEEAIALVEKIWKLLR
ncbi:MAG: HprK-related kinase A [Sphingorhabdus sp.]